jgi:hypothetical protein
MAPAKREEMRQKDLLSFQRQLDEARASLRLIQERMAEYVLKTDIPLQLIKEERRLLDRIAELEQQLATQPTKDGMGNVPMQLPGLGSKTIVVIGLIASCIAIFVFCTSLASVPEMMNILSVAGNGNPPIATYVPRTTPPTKAPLSTSTPGGLALTPSVTATRSPRPTTIPLPALTPMSTVPISTPIWVSNEDEICGFPEGTGVRVNGYPDLPVALSLSPEGRYQIFLNSSPDSVGALLGLEITVGLGRNQIRSVPAVYSETDLIIETADGRIVGKGDIITIDGILHKKGDYCGIIAEFVNVGMPAAVITFVPDTTARMTPESLNSASTVLQKRFDTVSGRAKTQITENTIRAELFNSEDITPTIQLAAEKGVTILFDSNEPIPPGQIVTPNTGVILTGADIAEAERKLSSAVELHLTTEGASKFTEYTRSSIGHYLVIVVHHNIVNGLM